MTYPRNEILTPVGGAERLRKNPLPLKKGIKAGQLDAFIVADDTQAKARVSTFLDSLGLRPLNVGRLHMAQTLESLGLLMISLEKNGAGTFDIVLHADIG